MYAQKKNNIYVNLFISGAAELSVGNNPVQIVQQNNYPWDGALTFVVNPKTSTSFNMLIRIPGWTRNEAIPSTLYQYEDGLHKKVIVKVNGVATKQIMQNGYWVINKKWKKGDVISVDLPMEVQKVSCNNNVKENIGKVALQRGPIMYCAEWLDNNGTTSDISLPPGATFTNEYSTILNGIVILKGEAYKMDEKNSSTVLEKKPFTAIPYYAWANRGKGEMQMWFPESAFNK